MTQGNRFQDSIKLCSIHDHQNLKSFVQECLGHGISRMKKTGIDKKFILSQINSKDELLLPLELVNHGHISPYYDGPSINIIHEDEDFLVMSKPMGVDTHPLNYLDTFSCLNFVRWSGAGNEILDVNKSSYDRGLLYRLDRETSGVLVAVKKGHLYTHVRDNFGSVASEKVYLAIAKGIGPKRGVACHYLRSTGKKGESVVATEASGEEGQSKLARIEFQRLMVRESPDLSLYKIKLFQGMRHQIRVQMSALGHPLLGDVKYGSEASSRLFLHAWKYQIELGDEIINFKDNSFELFEEFFDLNSIVDMLGNKV